MSRQNNIIIQTITTTNQPCNYETAILPYLPPLCSPRRTGIDAPHLHILFWQPLWGAYIDSIRWWEIIHRAIMRRRRIWISMPREDHNSLLGTMTMTMTMTMEREENSIIQITTGPYSKIDSSQWDQYLSCTNN